MIYDLTDHIRISPESLNQGTFNLWCPVVPDTPYQRVLDFGVEASCSCQLLYEPEHGNRILHAGLELLASPVEISIRYRVERLSVEHHLGPAVALPEPARGVMSRWLSAEQFVDVNDETKSIAFQLAGGCNDPIEIARRYYDYVVGSMTYDAANQSWKGSTEHALVCSAGNCNDIHALFISLCRSKGIPARLVLGQALETPDGGEEACDLCGYHCWAEFFVAGAGWLPADASCACKYGKHQLFGDLEMNHVAWSTGRDIKLFPAQQGQPLLFFAGPYAELDGKRFSKIERHIRFNIVEDKT
jgi:transglutaminase-like putative cysteine protease